MDKPFDCILSENQEFLNSLVRAKKAVDFKNIVNNSSEIQLKSIVETICNGPKLSYNKKEKTCLKKYKPLQKYFRKKKQLNPAGVRKFLIQRKVLVRGFIACVLIKIIEECITCACDQPPYS